MHVGLKEVVQSGAMKMPLEFILPLHLQPGLSSAAAKTVSLPVIDLSGLNDKEHRKLTATAITQASHDWGFFQVVGHGIPIDLRQRMLSTAREFFQLPLAEKGEFVPRETKSGTAFPVFGQTRKTKAGHQSWREVFKHNVASFPAAKEDVLKWPAKPESYRDTVMKYSEATKKITDTLLELMAEGLGLNSQFLRDALGAEKMNCAIMSAFYPRCPRPDLALGIIGHTDPNPMTILCQDAAGLEVKKDGVWIAVTPSPNAFIVNIGDVLQILSNDRLVSSEHRVVVNENEERVSVMLFIQPEQDMRIGVAPEFVSEEIPARYSDTTWNRFLTSYGLKGLDCKVTDFVQNK